jgi:hypothetical protein
MPYLLNAVSVSDSRCDNLICQKGFVKAESASENQTQVTSYFFRGKNKREKKSGLYRKITKYNGPAEITLKYETESQAEYLQLSKQIAEADYWIKSKEAKTSIYQFRDTEIEMQVKIAEDTAYEVKVQRKLLPFARNINFAEDLALFGSHENLLYVFGENNVRKDRYFFSDKEFSSCSVLYPNSSRQAVFIWKDENNLRQLSYVIIGGQLMTESMMNVSESVPENSWALESGIRIGMSLNQLRRINGADFNFFGGKSKFTGKIIPADGNIDLKRNEIILTCLNCHDSPFLDKETYSADEALKKGERFFIFSIIVLPALGI